MTSKEALNRLTAGNMRYIAGKPEQKIVTPELRMDLLKNGQKPYAAIMGCSDSRVPVELIFDAGLGELFVIRTAGNVAGPLEIGSLEIAIDFFNVPLVVVLGHQDCGAIRAAVNGGEFSEDVEAVIQDIRSSDGSFVSQKSNDKPLEFFEDAKVKHTLSKVAENTFISKAISEGSVRIIAARYSMETGIVTFFD
jgi:carbonic anhydrase